MSGFGRIPGKRALVAAAGAIMIGAGTLGVIGVTATAASAHDFVDVPCKAVATIGSAHLNVTVKEKFTVNVSAPTEANAGSEFTLTIPGANTALPSFDPGPPAVDLKTFSNLSNTYDVHGGTVVPGSITSSGSPKNNGHTVTGATAKFVGNSLVTGIPGPLDTGTLTTPTIKFKVKAGAAGSKVTTTPGTITLTTDAVLHGTTTAVNAAITCDLSVPSVVVVLSTTNVVAPPGADAPNAVSDAASTTKGKPVTIDVLANDTANKSFPIDKGSLKIVSDPAHGSANVNADGTVTYTPAAGFTGTDSFDYQLCSKLPAPTTTTTTTQEVPQVVKAAAVQQEPTALFCDKATVTVTVSAETVTTQAVATTVAPTTVAPAAQLPHTGSSSTPLALLGFGLVLSGLAATGYARSRRRTA